MPNQSAGTQRRPAGADDRELDDQGRPQPRQVPRVRRRSWGETTTGLAFVSPLSALLIVFVFVPLAWAVWISLQRTNGFGAGEFIGLDNFARLAHDPVFWRATLNTVIFTAIVTPLSMFIGLGMAVLLNSVLPARGVFRSILILPMSVSGVATALVGALMFDQDIGILDQVLRAVGLPTVDWQSSGTAAFFSVVLVTLWWRVGFNMLIYLAGLQSVDPVLHEAARLDGANSAQRFRHVTLPMLGPSTFFLVILNVVYSFQVFDIVFAMTGGGPGNATTVLVTYAYERGFVTGDQGYAAAIGMVLLILSLAFTVLRWRTSRTRDLAE